MKKIKICHIDGDLSHGGVEAMLYQYFMNFDYSVYEVHLISYAASDEKCLKKFQNLPITIHLVSSRKKHFFKSCFEIIKIMKKEHFDIVHSHMTDFNGIPLALALLCSVPVRISHSHMAYQPGTIAQNIYYQCKCLFGKIVANVYFACGRAAGEGLFGNRNVQNGKVTLIHNAISIKDFAFRESVRIKYREKLKLGHRFCIGHIGRFSAQKNHKFVLDILIEVVKEKPDVLLLLIGEGELRKEIEKLVIEYKLTNHVLFLGTCNNISDYYQAMDVFVLPSLFEGLCVTGIEAQAAGLKVLVSDRVTKEVRLTSNLLFLPVAEGDSKLWAREILNSSVPYKRAVSEEIARAGYDIEQEAVRLCRLYEELIFSKRG